MSRPHESAARKQFIALIPAYLNVFIMGWTTYGWIANAMYFFSVKQELMATRNEISLIVSCSELGKIVFSIPGGLLTDSYGRRKIIIIAALGHFICQLVISFQTSILLICITRFILGIATVMVNVSSSISIGEIASPEVRGMFSALYGIFMVSGILTPAIITAIFPSYYVFSYSIVLMSFICLVCTFRTMETPNYLISLSKYEEAKYNLIKIRPGYTENEINEEFDKLCKYIDEEKIRKNRLSWLTFVKSKSIAKPLGTFILLNYFTMATGTSVIPAYVTVIFPEDTYISQHYYPLITRVFSLLASFASTLVIERFPRRSIYMTGAILGGIICALCAVFDLIFTQQGTNLFKWLFIGSNLLFCFINNGTLLPMLTILRSELLPQSIKGIGGSLGGMAQALANVILFQMFYFVRENFGLYSLYLVMLINSAILFLSVLFLLPEGRGKFLADIQLEFINEPHYDDKVLENHVQSRNKIINSENNGVTI